MYKRLHLLAAVCLVWLMLDPADARCQKLTEMIFPYFPPPLNEGPWAQEEPPEGRPLYPGLFAHIRPVMESYSKPLDAFAGVENGSLYLRKAGNDTTQQLASPLPGWRWDVEGAKWSEDGTHLLVRQVNDRAVPRAEMKDKDGRVFQKEYSYVGDPVEVHQYYIVDVTNGTTVKIPHGYQMPYIHAMAWHKGKAWLLRSDRLMKHLELLAADPASGEYDVVIREDSDTYLIGLDLLQHYDNRLDYRKMLGFYEDYILWTSERSGYGQLYLYSLDGELLRPIPKSNPESTVEGFEEIRDGWVYFMENTITVGHPDRAYNTRLSRGSLTENRTEQITVAPVILGMTWAQDDSRFWVLQGSFERMAMEEYSPDGRHLGTGWEKDMTPFREAGFDPEFVWTKVPDDTLRIGSAILKPKDFDPAIKYPVVEHIYGGPFDNQLPWMLYNMSTLEAQDLANHGFIVVITDSRGTMYRGKDFRNYWYGKIGWEEVDDHAWAIRQIAKDRPYMDLENVGITGHSMGGYFTMRAMIRHPELYKAGFALAPNVDPVRFRVALEPYFGCLPADCPDAYAKGSVTDRLDQLTGELYIVHGTNDHHIPVSEAYRLKQALDDAGKENYELDVYDGMHHILQQDPSVFPKMVGFFERTLRD